MQDLSYERARDSKLFAGLMSLDEIKAKKARIESGEEFEGAAAKAARMRRADAELAAQERMVSINPKCTAHLIHKYCGRQGKPDCKQRKKK